MWPRLALAIGAAALAAVTIACGTDYFEIPIETPIQPKLDVSAFQRVLVAGFVAGGSEDVDANQETVRLLRSQLRTKSSLKVIDADVMPLVDIAQEQNKSANAIGYARSARSRKQSLVHSAEWYQRQRGSRRCAGDAAAEGHQGRKRSRACTNGCLRTPPTGKKSARSIRIR